jgi:hypothetical protein
MERRRFLQSALAFAWPQDPPKESVTATATQNRTPRVALVLSGSTALTAAQISGLLVHAVDLAATRHGDLTALVGPEDWVVLLAEPGADPLLVDALARFLASRRLGKRVTVAGPADLARAETQELPVPGGGRLYSIPKMILQCDRLLRVGPLTAARPALPDAELVDRWTYHPPDYTLLGSPHLLVASADPLAAASVALQILGLDPAAFPYLRLAADRGLGVWEPASIWVRGSQIEEARAQRPRN